jgi:Peptidase family M1 domain
MTPQALGRAQGIPAAEREVSELLSRLETALATGDPAQFLTLVSSTADRQAAEAFARDVVGKGTTRAVVRERDRAPLTEGDASGLRLIVEVFLQAGARGSVATWRLDVRREPATGAGRWLIAEQDRLTVVDGLYRLALTPTRQWRVRNLQVTSEDLTLSIPQGVAFSADSDSGPTAYVIVGEGNMIFKPKPAPERGQIRLFAGDETLRASFNVAFIRLNPAEQGARFSSGGLVEERVDRQALERAQGIFSEEVVKSFNLDLSDLSRETWSLVPPYGDMLAEIRTNRYSTLTYTQASNESEDISLFDRRRRRNISSYASERRLATRARFYSEDDEADYDVQHYDVQTHVSPEREWIEGRTVMRLRVRAYLLGTLTLRLAESLVVQSVTSPRFGRLLSLRVKGQNSVLVNLPMPLARGDDLTLAVTYAGRLGTATPEREVVAMAQEGQEVLRSELVIPPEPRILYTNRSYWYPQSTVTDYATASLRVTVPDNQSCVATGVSASGNPVRLAGRTGEAGRLLYVFSAAQPVRYLAVVVTRLTQNVSDVVRLSHATATLARNGTASTPSASDDPRAPASAVPQPIAGAVPATQPPPREGAFYDALDLNVAANPRQGGRVRSLIEQTSQILSRYAEIVGDLPYPSFTLTLVDDPLPGGHSPAYFALLHQPLPTTNYNWRNDPVSFDKFPQFFLAHELAHQYWGGAVGGENYHEQWISEGFAQYFAVLHAERSRSTSQFQDILRQMRRTSISYDKHGPVWLGYRLGHLQGDSRVFRALVYNKGALVLHMLRRLMGDDAFFRGMRRFYLHSRFTKVGTDDVQKAFEAEAGRSLERFFERWIMQSGIPKLVVRHSVADGGAPTRGGGETAPATSRAAAPDGFRAATASPSAGSDAIQGAAVTLRLEQTGEVFEFAVTVRLRYTSGEYENVLVPVMERTVERIIPLKGRLQDVTVNDDEAALVELVER